MASIALDSVCLGRALCALACFFSLTASAMPPASPEEMAAYRRDGSLRERVTFAQTLRNHRTADRLVQRAQRSLVERNAAPGIERATPPPAWKGMPTKGSVKFFTLAIDFSDFPADAANSPAALQSKIYGDGDAAAYPYESVRNFYRRSSYNQLELGGSVLGWYRPAYPRAYMENDSYTRENLIKEAIASFKAQGHDFSQYDNDGDGTIDYFAVVWTGPDNGWGKFWWSYKTDWTDNSYTVDGKRLDTYTWQWLSRPTTDPFSPRILIHETGHALGLPDYYDYNDGIGPKGGLGGLDMMDASWGDHNAFSKFLLGWIEPTVVTRTEAGLTLRASGTHPDAILLFPEAPQDGAFGEYFLLQNRHRTGNDSDLAANGLLVWHVDARLNATGQDFQFDNSYADHKLLSLVEADGLGEIDRNFGANAGDYWQQGMTLEARTTARFDGTFTWLGVRDISEAAPEMTLNVFSTPADLTAPDGLPATPFGPAAVVNENRLSFTWSLGTVVDEESPIVAWQIQIGTTPDGSELYDGLTSGTTFSLAGMAQDGTPYYARVRARNGAGLWSAWSAPSSSLTYRIPVVAGGTLDNPTLAFRTFGDGFWTESTETPAAGTTCAASPALTRGQVSHLETTVIGAGTLSFWVRTSCDAWDALELTIDGLPINTYSGENSWTRQTVTLGEGPHTLRWSFRKNTTFSFGADRTWIDGVTYTTTGSNLLGDTGNDRRRNPRG